MNAWVHGLEVSCIAWKPHKGRSSASLHKHPTQVNTGNEIVQISSHTYDLTVGPHALSHSPMGARKYTIPHFGKPRVRVDTDRRILRLHLKTFSPCGELGHGLEKVRRKARNGQSHAEQAA